MRDDTVETGEENLTTNFSDPLSKGHTLSWLLFARWRPSNPSLHASPYVIGVTLGFTLWPSLAVAE